MRSWLIDLALFVLLFLSFEAFAQKRGSWSGYPYSFERGDIVINSGLSIMHRNKYDYPFSYERGMFPAISVMGEVGLSKYIGIGPYLALFPRSFKYENNNESYIFHANKYYTGIAVGLHFSPLIEDFLWGDLDSEHADFYLNLSGGLKSTLFYGGTPLEDTQMFDYSALAGFRYYFYDHIGLYVETGHGPFEYVKVGLTTRL